MSLRVWFIWLTLIVALALDILPLPVGVIWLRPNWMVLVLIYWIVVMPYRVSVGYAFVFGLKMDLLQGSILGEHAVAMIIVAYIAAKMQKQMQIFSLQQQMLAIFLLLLVYKIVIFAIQGFIGQLPGSFLYWLSVLVDVILWPWLYLLLQSWRSQLHFEV